jgi:hypothetical protein
MKIEKIEEILYDNLIKKDKEIVISISGDWGIGKTYFWNDFIKKYESELKDKKIAYVSLFGQNSLSDIKTSILLQSSPTKDKVSWLNKKLKGVGDTFKGSQKMDEDTSLSFGLGSISSILSILSSGDFKNVIICIDDFERASSKIDFKDILGLISEFKEQKLCKVVMLFNEEELNKIAAIEDTKQKELFGTYKEKIIDIDCVFNSTSERSLDIILEKDNIKFTKEQILPVLQRFNIINIRLLRKTILILDTFSFILDENFNWLVINEFLEIAVSVLVIQNKYSFKQDDYIKIRQIVNGVNTNTSEKIKLLKDITSEEFKDLDNLFIKFENNGIEEVVFSLITHNVFDKEYLKEILKERNNQLSIYETKKILPNTWFKLHADFSYKKTDFQEEVKNIILENKNDIHFVIDIGSFHNYIQELNIGVDITQQDIDDIIKQYIDDFINKEISISIHEEYKLEVINEHYPHLVAYLENERKKVLVNGLTSEKANELIKKVTSGYGSKDEFILENISVIQFQTFILENPEFVRNLTTFVSGSISHSNSFMIAIRKIKNALANLKVMNSDYSYKVDTFLRETSIGLDYIIYNISTKPPVGSEKLSCIKI